MHTFRPFWFRPLLDPNKEGTGGGNTGGAAPDLAAELAALKEKHRVLEEENKKLKTPPKKDDEAGGGKDDDDLTAKLNKEKEEKSKRESDVKRMEKAIEFNYGAGTFVENHKELLPTDCQDLIKKADSEKYDSALEKSKSIKVAIIQSFFSVQANQDMLTPSQKNSLEDFLKLTKNSKEDKAEEVFQNIFEPTLESLKRVRKAEDVAGARFGTVSGDKLEQNYKERLIAGSRKTYLRETK